MVLSKHIREKIFLMEKAINFPASFSSVEPGHGLENLPMAPYSDLTGAVCSLAEKGRKVLIVTGFYVPAGNPPATETDGPPGALILAEGLNRLGMEVSLLSDEYTRPALKVGLNALHLSEKEIPLIPFPMEHPDADHFSRMSNEAADSPVSLRFVRDFFSGPLGKNLTHLIFIERVGPNHTPESIIAQERKGPPPLKEFEATLLSSMRNRCFSSRLEEITRFTAKTHFLMEFQKDLDFRIENIGIGDRGNEIGSGRIPWEVFKNLSAPSGAIFCCRMKTDHLISCGISNWGGHALVAGLALAKRRLDLMETITREKEWTLLDQIVRYGPAVDGLTLRQECSVDSIRFDDYVKVIEKIKEIAFDQTSSWNSGMMEY